MRFEPFIRRVGRAAALPAANIDTDVIMPKQFLKGIGRTGLAEGLFHGVRHLPDGEPDPGFVLNREPWREARFLVVGPNFGCGSSREHAVWGLRQFGIDALIGTSFAGIFFDNCARNGLLAIEAADDDVRAFMVAASDPASGDFVVDLEAQTVSSGSRVAGFKIDEVRKSALMRGLDPIGVTLEARDEILAFEAQRFADNPWLRL